MSVELLDLGHGTHRELGRRHGEAWAEEIARLFAIRWALARRLSPIRDAAELRRVARAHAEWLVDYDAPLADEVEGLAEGAGLEPWQLVVLNHYTDLVDVGLGDDGCSVVCVPTGFGPVIGQTWDMHQSAEPFVRLIRMAAVGEPEVVVFTLTGCVGMAGLSSAGVAVCINNLIPDDARIGVMWPALVRRMLREPTARAALDVLMAAPHGSGRSYVVADTSDVFGVEVTGAERRVIHQDPAAVYFHTNHYLDPDLARHELPAPEGSTTHERYGHLSELLRAVPESVDELLHVLGSHEGYPTSVCAHATTDDGAATRTCGGIVCLPTYRAVLARRGCLYQAPFRVVELGSGVAATNGTARSGEEGQ